MRQSVSRIDSIDFVSSPISTAKFYREFHSFLGRCLRCDDPAAGVTRKRELRRPYTVRSHACGRHVTSSISQLSRRSRGCDTFSAFTHTNISSNCNSYFKKCHLYFAVFNAVISNVNAILGEWNACAVMSSMQNGNNVQLSMFLSDFTDYRLQWHDMKNFQLPHTLNQLLGIEYAVI
jgi:hypothetical protein